MNKRRVGYIWDENLIELCDRLPAVIDRVSVKYTILIYIIYLII